MAAPCLSIFNIFFFYLWLCKTGCADARVLGYPLIRLRQEELLHQHARGGTAERRSFLSTVVKTCLGRRLARRSAPRPPSDPRVKKKKNNEG